MKKPLLKSLSIVLSAVLLLAQTHVLSAKTITTGIPSIEESVFSIDEDAMDLALSELNELDTYLTMNEGVSYADLEASGSELITNISDLAAPLGLAQEGEPPLGIPAFWWGCLLGWVGLLLVYIMTDQDKDQTKKAFTGCLVSSIAGLVLYGIYYGLIIGAAAN
ncbi:MAG TPA: hypothetical protein ENH59_03595 [Bacteroidetes bacterium]|nr:hypothetical protein [Bacteroidota bacterium]